MSSFRILCVSLLLLATACAGPPRGPYAPQSEANRDTARAQALSRQAVEIMETDAPQAEQLLRDALSADLFYGPAHNNLGALYLKQSKLYEAAGEFEWASKVMPGHPDPRMNLALTLERAGQIDQAIASYATALEVYPDHLPTMQAMSRCQLRHGRADERTPAMLEAVALRGENDVWRDWARRQLSRIDQ